MMELYKSIYRFVLRILSGTTITDRLSSKFPVSVKGLVVTENNEVVLLKTERQSFDFPGGKLNKNESLVSCLKREITEETGLEVEVEKMIHVELVKVLNVYPVLVIVYLCKMVNSKIEISGEHEDYLLYDLDNVETEFSHNYIDKLLKMQLM